ncbi:MAG: sn-glycerol-3-phosphate ABC transporter ATP-binding protein UgpC [Clostridiales Family XIII bacterium]|nr:sn-glycerol-3-phosphate ABC transporter ATP-binding protein UgpC [Clostridiales Family XIII bacterium]
MANVSLKHVYKIYPGDVAAVNDFNLEIADKEFVVLVGPSGCGKSTTLRMIAGLEEITGGELRIGDRVVNEIPPKDRDIAMVFQNYALYPHMTVYKNMAFGLELRKTPKDVINSRVREVARVLDIETLLNRKPKALSGGQRQRVALGRAMVRNPAVFLLDEPLSNLDAKLRASMRTELIQLHHRLETTFVYVTHDQIEAMTMGDRIVVMKDGFVQQVDVPQNLYDRPRNVFVAGFIGSPRMNFVTGVLRKDGDGFYFDLEAAKLRIPADKATGALNDCIGKEMKMGIRPEDIYDDEAALSAHARSVIETSVEVCELMGSEVYLYLRYATCRLIARVASSTQARPGMRIRAAVDMRRIHLFDVESEEAVLH